MTQATESHQPSEPGAPTLALAVGSMFGAMRHTSYRLYWTGMILSVVAQNRLPSPSDGGGRGWGWSPVEG